MERTQFNRLVRSDFSQREKRRNTTEASEKYKAHKMKDSIANQTQAHRLLYVVAPLPAAFALGRFDMLGPTRF